MKMLYILNVANRVNNFCMSSLLAAKKLDIEYHIAGNWAYEDDQARIDDETKYGIHIHQIDFIRSPLDFRNIKAYRQLKKLVSTETFDIIHCNTPIGGLLGRLVGKRCKVKKIIYEAHGFHFYKGAPILNWLIYYPIEKWLAHYTDTLITINQEDFCFASKKFHLRKNGKTYYVPGVGIDLSQFQEDVNSELRSSLGIHSNDIMIISAGDLVKRKNYKPAIKAIAETGMTNIKYCICGAGPQYKELVTYSKVLGIEGQIKFLGFRTDIIDLYRISDMFLLSTKQEGLPRSMMEAMACGLPCIASKVRGNIDLIVDGEGGYLCEVNNATMFANAIKTLANDLELRKRFGSANLKAIQKFNISEIINMLENLYRLACDISAR